MAEGSIAFDYEGATVRFGTGMASWDVATLNEQLAKATNGKLAISGLPEEIPESEWNEAGSISY